MVIRRCYLVLFGFLACLLMCKANDSTSLTGKLISPPQQSSDEPAIAILLKGSADNATKAASTKPTVTGPGFPVRSTASPVGDVTPIIPPVSPSTPSSHPDGPDTTTPSPTTPNKPITFPTTPTAPTSSSSTTATPNTTTTTSAKPTVTPSPTPSSTKPTVSPSTIPPHNGSVTTETPDAHHSRQFDGPSFIGGIVLAAGLTAIGFVAFKFYKARTERNYHTL